MKSYEIHYQPPSYGWTIEPKNPQADPLRTHACSHLKATEYLGVSAVFHCFFATVAEQTPSDAAILSRKPCEGGGDSTGKCLSAGGKFPTALEGKPAGNSDILDQKP